jgi:ABC-type glycerol-3-phosphate transport system permease component
MIYASGLTLLFFCGFPFLWMILTSIKPLGEIFTENPIFISRNANLANFHRLFTSTNFLTYFKNSIFVAGSTMVLTIVVASVAAYGLTRFRFWGRETLATMTLFTYMFAPIMIVIPLYIIMKKVGIVNTHLGLILSYTSFSLPFSLWLLRSFFQSIPLELEEAAMTDGASRAKAVVYVVIPMALPGVIATSIFTFILAWNDYIFTRILISSDELKTLPVGVQDLFNATVIDWGMIMASGVMIIIPALIFFITVQRYLIKGWGTAAVKG